MKSDKPLFPFYENTSSMNVTDQGSDSEPHVGLEMNVLNNTIRRSIVEAVRLAFRNAMEGTLTEEEETRAELRIDLLANLCRAVSYVLDNLDDLRRTSDFHLSANDLLIAESLSRMIVAASSISPTTRTIQGYPDTDCSASLRDTASCLDKCRAAFKSVQALRVMETGVHNTGLSKEDFDLLVRPFTTSPSEIKDYIQEKVIIREDTSPDEAEQTCASTDESSKAKEDGENLESVHGTDFTDLMGHAHIVSAELTVDT